MPRTAGSRVQSKSAFKGEGRALSADSGASTFRKQAGANRAVQVRLAAAEARARAAKAEAGERSPPKPSTSHLGTPPVRIASLGMVDLVSDDDEDDEAELDEDGDDTLALRFPGRNATGPATAPDKDCKPIVRLEDEENVAPFTSDELRYLRGEYDNWADDFLVVQGGAGSATATAPEGGTGGAQGGVKGKGKGKEVEVLTLDDSEEEAEGGRNHAGGGACCGYDLATAWADFERDVAAGVWERHPCA